MENLNKVTAVSSKDTYFDLSSFTYEDRQDFEGYSIAREHGSEALSVSGEKVSAIYNNLYKFEYALDSKYGSIRTGAGYIGGMLFQYKNTGMLSFEEGVDAETIKSYLADATLLSEAYDKLVQGTKKGLEDYKKFLNIFIRENDNF